MSGNNPFADEWRDCLVAHYQHVLAEKDARNEASLRIILESVGFAAEDLAAIREYYHPTPPTPEAELAEAELVLEAETLLDDPADAIQATEPTTDPVVDVPDLEQPAPAKPKKKPKQLTLFG